MINLTTVKQYLLKYWQIVALVVVSAFLYVSYSGRSEYEQESKMANKLLKKEIEISEIKAQKYVERINVLNDSLIVLQRLKQREKLKIVTVVKEVEANIENVGNLNTKGIANFYQNRYKLAVVITKYGVSLNDTIGKKSIVELVQKDGLVSELLLTRNVLLIEEKKGFVKDSIIKNKDLVIFEKDGIIKTQLEFENNLNKTLRKEKRKKNLWKLTAFGILGGGIYLLYK